MLSSIFSKETLGDLLIQGNDVWERIVVWIEDSFKCQEFNVDDSWFMQVDWTAVTWTIQGQRDKEFHSGLDR